MSQEKLQKAKELEDELITLMSELTAMKSVAVEGLSDEEYDASFARVLEINHRLVEIMQTMETEFGMKVPDQIKALIFGPMTSTFSSKKDYSLN